MEDGIQAGADAVSYSTKVIKSKQITTRHPEG